MRNPILTSLVLGSMLASILLAPAADAGFGFGFRLQRPPRPLPKVVKLPTFNPPRKPTAIKVPDGPPVPELTVPRRLSKLEPPTPRGVRGEALPLPVANKPAAAPRGINGKRPPPVSIAATLAPFRRFPA